jgi:hypothetical protein
MHTLPATFRPRSNKSKIPVAILESSRFSGETLDVSRKSCEDAKLRPIHYVATQKPALHKTLANNSVAAKTRNIPLIKGLHIE